MKHVDRDVLEFNVDSLVTINIKLFQIHCKCKYILVLK